MISLNVILIILYLVIVLAIGYFSSRKESKEDFMIGRRQLGPVALALTIAATFIGGNSLVTYSAFIYDFGIAVVWGLVGVTIGMTVLAFIGKKLKEQKKKYLTVSDFFEDRFGKNTALVVGLIILFWYSVVLLVQFIAGGKIIESLLGMPYWIAILIMGATVFIYSFMGGFKATVKTDVFQYLLFIVLAFLVGIFLIKGKTFVPSTFNIMNMGVGQSIAFVFLGGVTVFTGADMWQRVYAAKSKKAIKKGITIATILVLLGLVAIGTIGLAASTIPGLLPQDAFIGGLSSMLPPQFIGVTFVLLFAVIMSSIDTLLFVLATGFSEDIVRKNFNPNINKVKFTKIGMLIFSVVLMLIAIFVQDIVTLGLAFTSLGLAFAPVIIWAFFFKKQPHPKAVSLSLITGLAAVIILVIAGMVGPETSMVSLPVALIFIFIGQLIWRKKKT